MAFIGKMLWMTAVLGDAEACRRVACENVEDAKREGLITSSRDLARGLWRSRTGWIRAVVAAVVEGAAERSGYRRASKSDQDFEPHLRAGSCSNRDSRPYSPDASRSFALDLAGDEAVAAGNFLSIISSAAAMPGWRTTVHAGECRTGGVWDAVRLLGAGKSGTACARWKTRRWWIFFWKSESGSKRT